MNIELKNCPFCGGKASLTHVYYDRPLYPAKANSPQAIGIHVKCESCDAKGREFITDTDPKVWGYDFEESYAAACAWNMRSE